MKARIGCGSFWFSVVVILGFLALSGCGTTQNPDAGTIFVDRPEVFTRQRLINRRLAEQRWLENQLDKDADFTLQGYRDVREFTGFALALKGQFDPFSGAQAESLLPGVQRNPRIGELQDELQMEVLRRGVDYVKTNQALFTTNPVTNPLAPPTSVTNPLPAASATINLNSFNTTNALPVLPSLTNRYRSTAQLTSIQTLDDKLAYRNAIQARLREQELDDTHDLVGMTLYTLKFDITVAAGENNPSLGEVKLEMADNGEDLTTNDFENWLRALNRELRDESVGLQQRYLMGFLTEDEKLQLISLAIQQSSEGANNQPPSGELAQKPTNRQTALTFLGSQEPHEQRLGKNYFLDGLLEELNRGKPSSNGCQGLAFVVRDRYTHALGASVFLPQPTNGLSLEGNVFFLVSAKKGDYKEFTNAVKQATQSAKPYVYTVEPKEYAQNISDVAAREKLIGLSLALSATIPQAGASVGANTEYMRRSQSLLEAIKRHPLVVGFADGTTNFGWVVGPKFEIENAKVRFSHTHVQHSVQATVVVPAWWSKLKLHQSYSWLGRKGVPYPNNSGHDVWVSLPRDYAAITRALLALADQSLNKPSILPRWNRDATKGRNQITLQEGKDDTLLIRGRDLWRNPEVYIGGQQAAEVRVLPDMAGLRADFRSIRLPAAEKREAQTTDLTVVTSAGATVLRDGVRILPLPGASGEVEFARLINNFVVLSNNLVFGTDIALLPQSYAEIILRVWDRNQEELPTQRNVTGSNPLKAPQWLVPFIEADLKTNKSQMVSIELLMRAAPGEALTPVLVGAPKQFVYFKEESESQFKLETATLEVPPSGSAQIKLGLVADRELFIKAWPRLEESIISGTAKLFCENATNTSHTFTLPLQQPAPVRFDPLSVTVPHDQVASGSTNKFKLKLVVDQGQMQVPVAGELTIKRRSE